MKCSLVIEAKASVLKLRQDILGAEGYKTTGMITTDEFVPEFAIEGIAAISVGHSLPWNTRSELLAALKALFPEVPTIALLRRDEERISVATHSCAADDPVGWLRAVRLACGRC